MLSICSFPVLGFLAKSRTRSMAESIISDDDGGAADFAWSDARSVSVSPPDGRALLAGADRLIASGRLFRRPLRLPRTPTQSRPGLLPLCKASVACRKGVAAKQTAIQIRPGWPTL